MQGAGNGHVPDGTPRSRTRVDDRGRLAARPGEIPARGWKDVLARTAKQLKADDVSITLSSSSQDDKLGYTTRRALLRENLRAGFDGPGGLRTMVK